MVSGSMNGPDEGSSDSEEEEDDDEEEEEPAGRDAGSTVVGRVGPVVDDSDEEERIEYGEGHTGRLLHLLPLCRPPTPRNPPVPSSPNQTDRVSTYNY